MSEADAGGMAVEVELSCRSFISFVALRQKTAEEFGKMASEVKVHTKQRCDIKFMHAEKLNLLTLIDACWTFLETKQWM
jgi:hypothetical protein